MYEKKTILDTGSRKLYIERSKSSIRIVEVDYPLYPYGNNVKDIINIEKGENMYTVEYYIIRDGWNGTGCDHRGKVEITTDEYEKIMKVVENIRSLDDFEKLIELFREMKSERERRLDEIYSELKTAVEDFISTARAINIYNKMSEEEKKRLVEKSVDRAITYLLE